MKNTLLLWNSKNHGLIVILQSVLALYSKQNIAIKEVILLQADNLDQIQLDELNIFKENSNQAYQQLLKKYEDEKTRKRLSAVWGKVLEIKQDLNLSIQQKRLHITSVTDYQSIYNGVRKLLAEVPLNQQFHINVSPGTPQMHTVWLTLNSAGFLPSNARIWSTQFDKSKKKQLLIEIKFKPKTYLNEVFETSYIRNAETILINPNETISVERKKAEDAIQLYASIPNLSILLLGERGVGKTTYAQQFIHQQFYSNQPFEVIPCGIFSSNLMRSELFGYKKGAFSGADSDKLGILDKFKENGVLFLDEIHDLSNDMQRQLMQVLQNKTFRPIGGELKQTNFRLVTASNLPFNEVRKRLAPDFLDRISSYIVEIPPLRNCREDVVLAFQKNWKELFHDTEYPADLTLTKLFEEHPFCGNFRDLQKLAGYIYAFTKKHKKKKAIQLGIAAFSEWSSTQIIAKDSYFQPDIPYTKIINSFNQDIATQAISYYKSREKAAKQLGMSKAWLSKSINGKSR